MREKKKTKVARAPFDPILLEEKSSLFSLKTGRGLVSSVLVHGALVLLLFWGWQFLSRPTTPPPDEPIITVEMVAVDPAQTEVESLSHTAPVLKQSGPDEEGTDRPTTVTDAVSPIITSIQAEKKDPHVLEKSPPAPAPTPAPVPAPIPLPLPALAPLTIPLPTLSPQNAAKVGATLFGVQQRVNNPQAGTGQGDRWLNAIKADVGPVDRLIADRPGIHFPALYVLTIGAQGQILAVRVQSSSGNAAGDQAVMSHIRAASPVPPPPPDVQTPVHVILEIHGLGP